MNGVKKGLKISLIIVAIVLFLIIAYEVVISVDWFLDTKDPMSREEVVELLDKGSSYQNYYYSPQEKILGIFDIDAENKTEIYVKDNVKKILYNGNVKEWNNYNTNETILIMGEHEGKNYAAIGDLSSDSYQESREYNQMGFDYSLIANEENFNYDFKYLGKKQIDGRTCILVKVWDKDKSEIFSTKFLIDEQTGLITERTDYTMFGILLINIVGDRNLKLDIVTDEDIARPDLTGYEILQ